MAGDEWEIVYADGSTYAGDPAQAPTSLVCCIVLPPKKAKPGEFHRPTLLTEAEAYIYVEPRAKWQVNGWHGIGRNVSNAYQDLKLWTRIANVVTVLDGVQMDFDAYRQLILETERRHGMTRA